MLPSVDCELWRGTVTQEASMERDEMIFVAGASMRMLVTGGNECTNARQEYKIVCLVIMYHVSIILRY